MELACVFWWVSVVLMFAAIVACVKRGLQPNPLFKFANRLAGGATNGTFMATCGGMAASLLFGVLVYYVCLVACNRSQTAAG